MKKQVDFSKVKTIPINTRKNKVSVNEFVNLEKDMLDCIPNILAGKDFNDVVAQLVARKKAGKKVMVMLGAHVIKCGLAPMIIDMMKRGIIDHIAMNGAGSIHDFEVAYLGETSEDVASGLEDGTFGMSEETGKFIHEALKKYGEEGYGTAVGKLILDMALPHKEYSILANGIECGVPVSIHAAIGTEIIHQHPDCDGGLLGAATYEDFKIFTNTLSHCEGGAILNLGSAVILPEVFLKALTVVRNLGFTVDDILTANFDMIRHYRPTVNVVQRPTLRGGRGFTIVGMHEIMIPLLYHSLRRNGL